MSDHLTCKVNDGRVLQIGCLQYQCDKIFTTEDIKNFGSVEIYKKYVKFKQNIDIEMDPTLKWCPRKGCLNYVKR